jgi:hypothetical protein
MYITYSKKDLLLLIKRKKVQILLFGALIAQSV